MINRVLKSFKYAVNGIKTTWKEEQNFRIEIFAGLVVLFCMYYFRFSSIESALCIIAITSVLVAEIINTIVEDLCDKIQPSEDFTIGKIKDLGAAFVLVSVLGSVAIGIFVILNHFS